LSAPEYHESSSIGSEGPVKKQTTAQAPIFEINLAPNVSKFTPVRQSIDKENTMRNNSKRKTSLYNTENPSREKKASKPHKKISKPKLKDEFLGSQKSRFSMLLEASQQQ